jgi:hypothetical protein
MQKLGKKKKERKAVKADNSLLNRTCNTSSMVVSHGSHEVYACMTVGLVIRDFLLRISSPDAWKVVRNGGSGLMRG